MIKNGFCFVDAISEIYKGIIAFTIPKAIPITSLDAAKELKLRFRRGIEYPKMKIKLAMSSFVLFLVLIALIKKFESKAPK